MTSRFALLQVRAEREWCGAIAALTELLQQFLHTETCAQTVDGTGHIYHQGLVISGPLPVLSQPDLNQHFATWILTTSTLHHSGWMPFQLLPAESALQTAGPHSATLPLLPGDPLATEQFCLVMTPWFSLVMVLGETATDEPTFHFSFAPEVIQQAWEALRPRILLMSSHQIDHLDELVEQFPPIAPDYRTVMQFSRLMLDYLPEPMDEWRSESAEAVQKLKVVTEQASQVAAAAAGPAVADRNSEAASPDVELLQALAHEVRTPLTTIRTLTRLLLRRSDLPPDVLKRLQVIDRECSEQIDRFGLIFRAAELETGAARPAPMALTRTSLGQVFQQSIPRWQQQASQRQMTLEVSLPPRMPTIVSDPTMLDQALTSLIERFTRSLPAGSHILVMVMLAGSQLKVQLQSQPDASRAAIAVNSAYTVSGHHGPKSIGQLLTFQPETGNLSLNLAVTKNLFQAMGGKLIVRQRPEQGEVMTVFLPLERGSASLLDMDGSSVIEV